MNQSGPESGPRFQEKLENEFPFRAEAVTVVSSTCWVLETESLCGVNDQIHVNGKRIPGR